MGGNVLYCSGREVKGMHRVLLDKILYVYRFGVQARSWERSMEGATHFLAYGLHGTTIHEYDGRQLSFGKDMMMVANSEDHYRVLYHEMEKEGPRGGCLAVHFTTVEPFDLHLAVYDCAGQPQIRSDFFRLLDTWNQYRAGGRPADEYACVSCFYSLLSRLFLLADHAPQSGDRLAEAKEYLARNYADSTLCIADAAERAGLGQRRFGELFAARYRQTPGKYLTQCRMAAAVRLLKQEEMNMSAIASLTGYASASYFIRVFRQEMGVSPSVYRRQERND